MKEVGGRLPLLSQRDDGSLKANTATLQSSDSHHHSDITLHQDAEGEAPRYTVWFKSIASPNHPETNQDTFIAASNIRAIGVFDGMGSKPFPEVASREASSAVLGVLRSEGNVDDTKRQLKKSFDMAANYLRMVALEHRPQLHGMGTTAAVAQIVEEGNRRFVVHANAGDSRIMVVKANGRIVSLTCDDNQVEAARRSGELTDEQAAMINEGLDQARDVEDLAESYATSFWMVRNALSNMIIEGEGVEPAIDAYELHEEDVALLATTDGVHKNLTRREMEDILSESQKNQVERLVRRALDRSLDEESFRGIRDDITAVMIKL